MKVSSSFCAFLVILALVLVACTNMRETSERDSTSLLSSKDYKVLPEIRTSMECVEHNGRDAVVIPLISDDNNIYNIDLEIGGVWVRAAVDTGSEALVISGADCERCLTNSEEQGYIPMPVSPIHVSMMRYGSQTDSVSWDIRPVKMKGWQFTCDENKDVDLDSAITTVDNADNQPACIVGNVSLAVVSKRTGTSNYNVLGLGARTEMGPPSFLSSLFPEPPRAFSFLVQSYENARLILHRATASCDQPRHKFAIDRGNIMSHQYLLNFDEILMNDEALNDVDVTEYRLMLDTGANALSLPRDIFNHAQEYHPKGVIGFTLRNIHGENVTLQFPYDMSDRYNAQVLNAGYSNKVIVGVTFCVGMAIGILETGLERFVTVDW